MLTNTTSLSVSFCSARLIRPIFGLASMIHDTVNRMPGMTSGMIASAKNNVLKGVLVRSFIQASVVPTTSASTPAPVANCSELRNSRAFVGAQIGGAEILQGELRRRRRGLRREEALPEQEHQRDEASQTTSAPARRSVAISRRNAARRPQRSRRPTASGHWSNSLRSRESDGLRHMVPSPFGGGPGGGDHKGRSLLLPPSHPSPRRGEEQTEFAARPGASPHMALVMFVMMAHGRGDDDHDRDDRDGLIVVVMPVINDRGDDRAHVHDDDALVRAAAAGVLAE